MMCLKGMLYLESEKHNNFEFYFDVVLGGNEKYVECICEVGIKGELLKLKDFIVNFAFYDRKVAMPYCLQGFEHFSSNLIL